MDGHYFGRATDYQLSPDGKTIYICYENTGALTETSNFGQAYHPHGRWSGRKAFLTMTEIFVSSVTTLFPYLRLRNRGTPDFSAVPLVDHVEEIIQTAANGGAALPLFTVEGVPLLTLRGSGPDLGGTGPGDAGCLLRLR